MIFKIIALTLFLYALSDHAFSQLNNTPDKYEIRNEFLNLESKKVTGDEGLIEIAQTRKNPGLAMLLSLVLPGAGHFYVNRMDVGKYFVAAEVTSWLGVLGLNIYGDAVRDDARSFAVEHAQINKQDKDNDFFANIGNYNNVYEYNDDKLRSGEYDKLYDAGLYFWNWDNVNHRFDYEEQRRSSERIYNSRIIFGTALIVNRIVSGISSLILANVQRSGSLSGVRIDPQITFNKDKKIDGFRLNFGSNLSP